VHYLEKIVKYYAPNLALDVNSLRDVSRNLSVKHQDSDSEAAGSQEELDNLGDLALDEDFTIQTGPNNTTRMWILFAMPSPSLLTGIDALCRVFRRILPSQFFHENSAEN
jgi:hypothetical protein